MAACCVRVKRIKVGRACMHESGPPARRAGSPTPRHTARSTGIPSPRRTAPTVPTPVMIPVPIRWRRAATSSRRSPSFELWSRHAPRSVETRVSVWYVSQYLTTKSRQFTCLARRSAPAPARFRGPVVRCCASGSRCFSLRKPKNLERSAKTKKLSGEFTPPALSLRPARWRSPARWALGEPRSGRGAGPRTTHGETASRRAVWPRC